MKSHCRIMTTIALLSCATPVSAATRYFGSAGPSATENYGFRGGWGVSFGVDRPMAESVSLLFRADLTTLPSSRPGNIGIVPLSDLALGESGPDAARAALGQAMLGLRLEAVGAVRPYLDSMLGLGHVDDPGSSALKGLNTVLSFGTGLELPRTSLGSPFAEVRYDFHFASGRSTPVMPVRVGLIVP